MAVCSISSLDTNPKSDPADTPNSMQVREHSHSKIVGDECNGVNVPEKDIPGQNPLPTFIGPMRKAGIRAVSNNNNNETNDHEDNRSEVHPEECEKVWLCHPLRLRCADARIYRQKYDPLYCYNDAWGLSDGTIVKGKWGVTFAGFVPASRTKRDRDRPHHCTTYEYYDTESELGESVTCGSGNSQLDESVHSGSGNSQLDDDPPPYQPTYQEGMPTYLGGPLAENLRGVTFNTACGEVNTPRERVPLAAEPGHPENQAPLDQKKKSKDTICKWEDIAPAWDREIDEATFQKLAEDVETKILW